VGPLLPVAVVDAVVVRVLVEGIGPEAELLLVAELVPVEVGLAVGPIGRIEPGGQLPRVGHVVAIGVPGAIPARRGRRGQQPAQHQSQCDRGRQLPPDLHLLLPRRDDGGGTAGARSGRVTVG
jgi:hypothetical protein